VTGAKGVHSQEAATSNHYNHNFQNKFCGCGEEYDADQEKGTMFQCLGLGTVETGGCGEDWWHPECLMGLSRDWRRSRSAADQSKLESDSFPEAETPCLDGDDSAPPGFPAEEDFEAFLCFKCVESNPWIKQYAGAPGFLPPVFKGGSSVSPADDLTSAPIAAAGPSKDNLPAQSESKKRKASVERDSRSPSPSKRIRQDTTQVSEKIGHQEKNNEVVAPKNKHDILSPAPQGIFSLFLREGFRDRLCHCPKCYPNLIPHPQLIEEEDTYEPPVSESGASDGGPGSGTRSHGTGSLLERGEAALSNVDRVRAIEGVMVYNHLKDKVKDFLKPYAESGKAVGADDIKAYFEKLRGDDAAMREAGTKPGTRRDEDKENDRGAGYPREQRGY
jgi:E3 ubiquitin-protein ligase UBR7